MACSMNTIHPMFSFAGQRATLNGLQITQSGVSLPSIRPIPFVANQGTAGESIIALDGIVFSSNSKDSATRRYVT